MGQRYGVLISASAKPFYSEFFYDVVNMRLSLLNHGFQPNNIFVLYGNGNDYADSSFPAPKYNPNPPITNMAATITNIQLIFNNLSTGTNGFPRITNQDLLFVYTFDHGSDKDNANNSISALCLNDGKMRADDFATAVDQVNYAYRIFCMQQCFSGGFISFLSNDRTVILTAAASNEVATPIDTEQEIIVDPLLGNVSYPHGEFNWHLFAALDGTALDGTAINADADSNTFLTMEEVFNYIQSSESRPETPQYDDGNRDIGKRLHLGFADLCMRDNLSDTGVEPSTGDSLCVSPDICHFRNQLLDPAAILLDPSNIDKDTLFENIEKGQSNWIYLRIRNRGYVEGDAKVDLYWTDPTTLPTPPSWSHIGTITVPVVQPDQWVVAGPLEWPSNKLPDSLHCCFVGILSNTQDPAPNFSTVTDSGSFHTFIRNNNNVVWKNFDVVNMFKDGYSYVEFRVQGWPRVRCLSDLEIGLLGLPVEAKCDLKMVKRITKVAQSVNMTLRDESELFTRYDLESAKVCVLRDLNLNPSDNTEATISVSLPQNIPNGDYNIWVRQVIGGKEVGRVTRRLCVGEYQYVGNSKTKELHLRGDCEWETKMSGRNRVAFGNQMDAVRQGYNGCATCMPEIDTD